ncbi:MAG: prepilin-type N-terminal cleavage/methylation domain-containing protein [Armatimonadetes bacterium]|nr:prepilin-type N-terminal cleavage/methylation domain-containing protein [Armatimonadota bacterium]
MIHSIARKTSGFTLTELIVVIGIMAMLIAIIIPATQSLRKGNRVSTCAFQLHQISNAMKAYHFDYGSVPPRYPGYPGPFVAAAPVDGPGLVALWETGYLSNRRALHCPSDTLCTDPNVTDYYLSYMDEDLDAAALFGFDNYKYLSTRGVDSAHPAFKRQLEDPAFYDPATASGRTWYPDDRTVVAWCNLHANEYFRDDEGQYQVLFWDGSTKTLPASLFDGTHPDAPAAAWMVYPDILE